MQNILELANHEGGKRGLFVGSGPSSAALLRKPLEWWRRNYDFIIAPNCGYKPLANIAVSISQMRWYAFSVEANIILAECWRHMPPHWIRIMNSTNKYWATRCTPPISPEAPFFRDSYACNRIWYDPRAAAMNHKEVNKLFAGVTLPWKWDDSSFDPRSYGRGLLKGPPDEIHHSRGTVMLQAMHFAAFLGAASLSMIGCELCFMGGVRHYFEDADATMPIKDEYVTHVEVDGQPVRTHKHFANSAAYIDSIYPRFEAAGMRVVRHCGGLLKDIPYEELAA